MCIAQQTYLVCSCQNPSCDLGYKPGYRKYRPPHEELRGKLGHFHPGFYSETIVCEDWKNARNQGYELIIPRCDKITTKKLIKDDGTCVECLHDCASKQDGINVPLGRARLGVKRARESVYRAKQEHDHQHQKVAGVYTNDSNSD
ncbi:hypothetical protein N3K66_006872 [Trichothecium roseum]|uniref:Uncharacterized protein n=1 Tax=Trichothecium roseum TaxID=47278 RepID=A0ACC0UWL4_9HYPO|nr:hypothetical protein N3K66_006872 [Trichothecium roseum]